MEIGSPVHQLKITDKPEGGILLHLDWNRGKVYVVFGGGDIWMIDEKDIFHLN